MYQYTLGHINTVGNVLPHKTAERDVFTGKSVPRCVEIVHTSTPHPRKRYKEIMEVLDIPTVLKTDASTFRSERISANNDSFVCF
jgi:hypothetical protein